MDPVDDTGRHAPDVREVGDVREEKRLLRAELNARRRRRSGAELAEARAAVRSVVLRRCIADGWRRVAAYVPLRTEPGSVELLDELVADGVGVIVPVTLPDRDLDWAAWPASGAGLGLDAVSAVDAVLVPALAVATDGTRLGRGGGSYDRALARCATGMPLVALLFDGELVGALPREAWDRPVTAAVTPSGWTELPETDRPGNGAVAPAR